MAKNKISEFSSTPANNTDIAGINIAEGCAPSGINNALRELMAQLKDQQAGTDGDNFTVGGNLSVTGTASGATPSVSDDSTKFATTAFVRDIVPAGVIVMWSGSVATIPSGWYICDGTNSTPDLRNRFIVGAGSTYSVAGTGGSADAIVVSHTHTATSTVTDPTHQHISFGTVGGVYATGVLGPSSGSSNGNYSTATASTGITVATTNASTGSSGTNANLPPYYALAYIMKA